MTDYEHMSWCQGDHSDDGDCVIHRHVDMGDGDTMLVDLSGLRCDHFAIYFSDGTCLTDGADVDEYAQGLEARLQGLRDLAAVVADLRPLLDQSESLGEMDCDDTHNHDANGPPEEDEECCGRDGDLCRACPLLPA